MHKEEEAERRTGPAERRHYTDCPHYDNCPARTPEHEIEHDFTRSAMRIMARLETAKWTAFNTVIVLLVLFLFGSLGLGLIEKLREALRL